MAGTAGAKRKAKEAKLHSRPNKKFKKQARYSSGSESEDEAKQSAAPALQEEGPGQKAKVSKRRDARKIPPTVTEEAEDVEEAETSEDQDEVDASTEAQTDSEGDSAADSDADSDSGSDASSAPDRKKLKRRDPNAFASSMNAILSSKLTTSNRKDPVLARSKTAAQASHELAEAKLEAKARRKMRDEKRALNEKGRVRNVLLGDRRGTPGLSGSEAEDGVLSEGGEGLKSKGKGQSAAEIAGQERRLRKTAQRGVVKLFNAVRASQVKAEEASRDAKTKGTVGVQRREERVGEMGRQAFLDLVGKGKVEAT